jgi:hypothetical protein
MTLANGATPDFGRRLVERLRSKTRRPMRLEVDRVVVLSESPASSAVSTGVPDNPAGSTTLYNVEAELAHTSEGAQAWLRFDLAEQPTGARPLVRVGRDRRTPIAYTWIEIDSGEAALPCRLAADLLPAAAVLGEQALFRGRLVCWPAARSADVELQGSLTHVELNRLVSLEMGREIQGLAQFDIQRATFVRGRLVAAAGAIRAREGTIERGWIKSLATALQMRIAPGPEQDADSVGSSLRFDQIGLQYQLSSSGLVLQGACEGEPQDIILTGPGVRLQLLELGQPRSIADLVSIGGNGQPHVVLNPWTAKLASLLPLDEPRTATRP